MKTTHWPVSLLSGTASFVNLLIPIVMSRALSADEIGHFRVFFLYLSMVPAFSLGAGLLNGLYYWSGRGDAGRNSIAEAWRLLNFCAFGFSGLCLLLLFSVPSMRAIFGAQREVALLFALAAAPTILGTFYEHVSVAAGKIWSGAAFVALTEVIRTTAIISAIFWGRDLRSVLWTHFICSSLKAAAGAWLSYRQGLLARSASPVKSAPRAALGYAFPVSVSAVLDLLVTSSDRLILSALLPASRYAVYAMGCLWLPPLLILEQSVNKVMIPRLSEKLGAGDRSGAAATYQAAVEELMCFHVPAAFGLMVFSSPIVEILYTTKFMEAAPFLRAFSVWYILMAIPHDAVARASGNSAWILKLSAIFGVLAATGAVTGAFLGAGTGGSGGAMGALIAYLLVTASQKIYALNWSVKKLHSRLDHVFPIRKFLGFCFISGLLSAGVLGARPAFHSDKAWFLILAPVFAILYLPAAFLLRSRLTPKPNGPPQVLLLMPYLSVGGLERMVLALAQELKTKNLAEPSVFAFEATESTLKPLFEEKHIPVHSWNKGPGFSFKLPFKIVQLCREKRVSVIHTHDIGALIYGVLARWISAGSLRVVHTQHNAQHFSRGQRYRYYEKFLGKSVHAFCSVSTAIAETTLLETGIETQVIENGVGFPVEPKLLDKAEAAGAREKAIASISDPRTPKNILSSRIHTHWILCLSRIAPGKGQDVVFEVWSLLSEKARANATLIFVGPESQVGFQESLQNKWLKKFDPTWPEPSSNTSVVFAGPSLEPSLWYNASDIFISGSTYEGLPLAPLEALGRGLPALLSDIPGHQVFSKNALLFNGSSSGAEALSRLIDLADLPALRWELWKKSASIRDRFSVSAMALSYARHYSA